MDDAGARLVRHVAHRGGGDVGGPQLLGHATAGAGALGGEDEAPLVVDEGADVRQRLLDVAAVGPHVPRADVEGGVVVRQLGIGGEGGQGPPSEAARKGQGSSLGVVREGGLVQGDGDIAAGRGGGPRGREELLRGGHEVLGAAADALGFGEEDEGVVGHEVEDGLHAVHEGGGEGLHALDCVAVGDAVQHVGGAGQGGDEGAGACADGVGEDELAGRGRPEPVHEFHGALVRHGEGANLLDRVPEELHAQGVGVRGREDVEEAAANGELAAAFHHVHAGVCGVHQVQLDLAHVRVLAGAQGDGDEIAEPRGDRLEEGPDRHDEHPGGVRLRRRGIRVGEAAEHGEAAGDGVRARREPLVGQGLPRGEDHHGVLREIGAQCEGGFVRLAGGGGDDHDGAVLGGSGDERGAHAHGDRDAEHPAAGNTFEGGGEARVPGEHGEEAGEIHDAASVGHRDDTAGSASLRTS